MVVLNSQCDEMYNNLGQGLLGMLANGNILVKLDVMGRPL